MSLSSVRGILNGLAAGLTLLADRICGARPTLFVRCTFRGMTRHPDVCLRSLQPGPLSRPSRSLSHCLSLSLSLSLCPFLSPRLSLLLSVAAHVSVSLKRRIGTPSPYV